MFYVLNFDCDAETLRIIYLIKVAFNIIKIAVPILLIIMCMFNILKMIISKEGWNKKIIQKIVFKLVAAVLVYMVPTMINLGLSVIGESNFTLGTCWKNATKENVDKEISIPDTTVSALENAQNNIEKALEQRRELQKEWEGE